MRHGGGSSLRLRVEQGDDVALGNLGNEGISFHEFLVGETQAVATVSSHGDYPGHPAPANCQMGTGEQALLPATVHASVESDRGFRSSWSGLIYNRLTQAESVEMGCAQSLRSLHWLSRRSITQIRERSAQQPSERSL